MNPDFTKKVNLNFEYELAYLMQPIFMETCDTSVLIELLFLPTKQSVEIRCKSNLSTKKGK